MRKKFIGANWKMNLLYEEAIKLFADLSNSTLNTSEADIVVFPSSIYLSELSKMPGLPVGAQDLYFADSGAFTGGIAARQLKSISCKYVLVGHSERRITFFETDEVINLKLKSAVRNDLKVVFCCGESLGIRESKKHLEFVTNQLMQGWKDLDETEMKNCIIAYEPIWAIGTGLNASKMEIEEMHGTIRRTVASCFSHSLSQSIRIVYGGSCNQHNASDIFSFNDVDGGLIGGASLEFDSFEKIIKSL
jgi:triosephosphate isomerase